METFNKKRDKKCYNDYMNRLFITEETKREKKKKKQTLKLSTIEFLQRQSVKNGQ